MFSIIIPVYNVAPFIIRCLDSILRQDCKNWEAILVDDGSTDDSGAICDRYAALDNRFRVFHKQNGGVSSARNVGLEQARGEWIWYVDPDDWISDIALSSLTSVVEGYKCDTVFFGIEYYDETNVLIGLENRESIFDKSKNETIILGDYPPPNYLLRREIIENYHLRFSEGVPTGEDLEFQYKYLMLCQTPISINKRLYCCLIRQGSAMRNPRTLDNMAKYSPVILEHLVTFIADNGISEDPWLAARLNRTFKSVMSSNCTIDKYREGLQHRLRAADKKLKDLCFRDYSDFVVKIGVRELRIYFWALKLRKFIKR